MKWYVGTMGWKRKERNEYERRSSVGFYVAHNANGLNYVWREKLRVWGVRFECPKSMPAWLRPCVFEILKNPMSLVG